MPPIDTTSGFFLVFAQLEEAAVQVVAGGDAAAGTVDAQDDGLDGVVLGGLLDLLVDVAEAALP